MELSDWLCALKWLTPLLRTGSLLLFDEFLGENESEKRAFEKWSLETGCRTILIGQFLREPSGRGTKLDSGRLDQRTLFQVIKEEPLRAIPSKPDSEFLKEELLPAIPSKPDDGYLRRQLSKYPPLYNAARQIYRLIR